LIWLYFWLLIFEGALRKWFLPSLSNILLVVRDPVAAAILILAIQGGVKFPRGVGEILLGMGILFGFLGLIHIGAGLITPKVFLFGMRTYFLHLPLVFVMGKVLTQDDLRSFSRWVLLISIPMAVLMAVQFVSPAGSTINKGVGDEGLQIISARDHIRASGTFSFITGPVAFFTMVMAFCLSEFVSSHKKGWNVSHAALACCILVGATAGSRSLLASMVIVAVAMLVCIGWGKAQIMGGVKVFAVGGLSFALLSATAIFKEGVATMTERTEGAANAEGGTAGFVLRITDELTSPLWAGASVPIYGAGVGLGTNVGAVLATGDVAFLMSEGEWGRVFCEVGFLGGFLFIGFRTWLVGWLFIRGLRGLKQGNAFALLLAAACSSTIWNGQWGQPTALGFATFVGGLACAAGEPAMAVPVFRPPQRIRRPVQPKPRLVSS